MWTQVNMKNSINGSTPLHLAAQEFDRGDQEGRIEAIKMLLAADADPYIPDMRGKFPSEYSKIPEVHTRASSHA